MLFAQGPAINWLRTIGGPGNDQCRAVDRTADGGSIVLGISNSVSGDVPGNHGSYDATLVRFDQNGEPIWQWCYGGPGWEEAYSVISTADGGFTFAGLSGSINGGLEDTDLWVVHTDGDGDILWQQTYGGSGTEYLGSVVEVPDGGYLVTCHTNSSDGDVQGWHAGYDGGTPVNDVWVVRLAPTGEIVWSRCLGGSRYELSKSAVLCSDGGFIIGACTSSPDGDVVGYHYSSNPNNLDAWLVKLAGDGAIEWSRAYGGTGREQYTTVTQAPNGDFFFSGSTNSSDGDVSTNYGEHDVWLAWVSATGDLLTERSLGGPGMEVAYGSCLGEDGRTFVIGSATPDESFELEGYGGLDVWFMVLDAQGNVEQQTLLGGSNNDWGFHVRATGDGRFLAVGSSTSFNGDLPGNHGGEDGWVASVDLATVGIEPRPEPGLFITPTIATDRITISTQHVPSTSAIELLDATGRTVLSMSANSPTIVLELAGRPRGLYFISAMHKGLRRTERFILE